MERNNFMSLQQCRACFILTIKYFTKFFHCFLPCKCRTMDDVLRNLSLNITQALSKDTRFLHLLQMHSPSWLTQLFATQTKCPCAPSFLTRHIQSGAFFDAVGTGKGLGASRMQMPPTLCQCLEKGYSGAHPHESQEPGSIIWKDHQPIGTGSQD